MFPVLPRLKHLLYAEGTTVTRKKNAKIGRVKWYGAADPVDLGDVSYLIRAYYDHSLLSALLPPHLVDSAASAMYVPMEAILRGEPQECEVNRALNWDRYRNLNSRDKTRVVVSHPDFMRLRSMYSQAAFTQIIILVASEVGSRLSPDV